MAGIKEVYIGNFDENAAFTFEYQQEGGQDVLGTDGNKIKASIKTFTPGTGFKVYQKFSFRKQTGSMVSTLTTNDNGTNFWETACNLVFAKMDSAKRLSIMSLMQGETSIVVVDNNGNRWFMGLDNPCTMTEGTGETGTAYSDNNAYTITLGDTSLILPLPVSDEAFAALTTQA